MAEPDWSVSARKLNAIAQNGLTFAKDPFDIERYAAMRELAVEILVSYTQADTTRLTAVLTAETRYAPPKVDVRGVVFRDDKVLMVKERQDGGWTLPGGWADVGETPSEAVVKEIREEAR